MTLHCVFDKSGSIIGRFTTKEKALDYLIDDWFDGYEDEYVKSLSKEEYLAYPKNLIQEDCIYNLEEDYGC